MYSEHLEVKKLTFNVSRIAFCSRLQEKLSNISNGCRFKQTRTVTFNFKERNDENSKWGFPQQSQCPALTRVVLLTHKERYLMLL